jgi:hypothetical protein
VSTPNNHGLPVRPAVRHRAFGLGDRRLVGIPEPVNGLVTSETLLLGWFERAEPGERFIYHIGHLGADRARDTSCLSVMACEALGRIAGRVMVLAEMGQLIAVQQRLNDGRIAYIAIKRGAEPKPASAPRADAPDASTRLVATPVFGGA